MQAFEYRNPTTLAAAAAAAAQEDSKLLAGGQSLLQSMKLGLAAPALLIDLGGIAETKGIRVDARSVTIGAGTTHAAVAPLEVQAPMTHGLRRRNRPGFVRPAVPRR